MFYIWRNYTEVDTILSSYKKCILAALLIVCLTPVHGQQPVVIIGGVDDIGAYASFVHFQTNTADARLTNLPTAVGSKIFGVAINNLGQAIVGGKEGTTTYAAFVNRSANLAGPPVSNLKPGEALNCTAINDLNQTLVAGPSGPYAAFIDIYTNAAGAAITNAPPPNINTFINGVSINNAGQSILAGVNQNVPYAAYVNPATNAVTSTISNLPGGGDTLYASSINQHGLSLIGGRDAPNGLPYAAFIQPNATEASAPISSLLTANLIYAVALNDYGQGLIGGFTSTSTAYAAFVDPITNTAMPPISNLPTATGSVIYGVALNNFGQAIVGGTDGTKAYAAFVDPITNRASDPILNIPTTGGSIIYAVGLVMTPQIPSNTLTGNNRIFANYISENAQQDVFYFIPAWINGTLTDALESAAPTRNAVSTYTASNNLFYLAGSSFATHLRNQRKKGIRPETASVASKATVAFAEDELLASLKWWSESRQQKKLQQKPYSEKPYTIWFDAIGVFSYQKAQDQTVGFNPFSGGVVLAFDRVKKNLRSGVGASYLYTHVHEKKGQGHSNINQENLFAYLSWNEYQFYVDGLLLGGLFQTSQVRNIQMTGFNFSQSSKPKGWQLLPHFEFGYNALLPTHRRDLDVDLNPFVMLDWANNWQGDFVETGNGVFGCSQQEQYGSLLRTEVGLRFNETLLFETWALFFLEKMSYVNIHSFNAGRVTASLIGFPGSFTLETLSSDQNLGVAQVEIAFIPLNPHHPSASFFYQGEFGTQYQSHQINAELSWHF